MNKEEFDLFIIILIKNALMVLLFTLLAIVFDKWWLVLLSPLFFTTISKGENK